MAIKSVSFVDAYRSSNYDVLQGNLLVSPGAASGKALAVDPNTKIGTLVAPSVAIVRARAVDPPFPPSIAGLVAWYDASRITGLSDGAAVSQWNDSSGNTNHATQGTAGLRPIYKVNIVNGLPVVRFDGIDDYLLTGSLSPAVGQPSTVLWVGVRRNSIAANDAWFDSNTGANRQIVYTGVTGFVNWFSGTNRATGTSEVINTTYVYTAQFNGASSILRRNGTQIDTGNVGAQTLPELQLGNGNTTVHDNPLDGDIAELAVYNRALAAGEIALLETYYNGRYGAF